MAINPNTDFSSGAVLTAAQQNRFPRGIMALTTDTTSANFTVEAVDITSAAFVAVANRYYQITYYVPNCSVNIANGYTVFRIRKGATTAGTQLTAGIGSSASAGLPIGTFVSCVTTLTAGSQQVCATITSSSTSSTTYSATQPAYLLVEDIGPA
jgi:hypothetical protein